MPDAWMSGLIRDPGAGATYPKGRNAMQFVAHHDTGGTNSYEVCRWGRAGYGNSLCNILLPKVGVPWQFAPIDALTYHAGSPSDYDKDGDADDYNPVGPGLEVERFQGEDLTADQITWLGRIGLWLAAEWGLPNVQYRGPQYGADDFRGHVNHRDLHPNLDGLSPTEWDAVAAELGPGPIDPNVEDDDMSKGYLIKLDGWVDDVYWRSGTTKIKVPGGDILARLRVDGFVLPPPPLAKIKPGTTDIALVPQDYLDLFPTVTA